MTHDQASVLKPGDPVRLIHDFVLPFSPTIPAGTVGQVLWVDTEVAPNGSISCCCVRTRIASHELNLRPDMLDQPQA